MHVFDSLTIKTSFRLVKEDYENEKKKTFTIELCRLLSN